MGTWDTTVFSDDLAQDVREEFRDMIAQGLSAEEATAKLVLAYKPATDMIDVEPVFWIALAVTQHELGRLIPSVKANALLTIENGTDLVRWRDAAADLAAERTITLKAVAALLESPQPAARRIKTVPRSENDWPRGAIVSYQIAGGGLGLFEVVGHHSDKGGRYPIVRVLDWQATASPTPGAARWLLPRRDRLEGGLTEWIITGERHFAGRFQVTNLTRWKWLDLLTRSSKPKRTLVVTHLKLDEQLHRRYDLV